MTEEEIEKVAVALVEHMPNAALLKMGGGMVPMRELAKHVITTLDRHREGKAKGLSRKHYRHKSEATYPLAFAASPTKEEGR